MVVAKMTCLLCRGLIAFKDRDQARFLDHMQEEHNVRYDFNVLLVATLMNEEEKKTLVQDNKEKFATQKGNTEIKATVKETTPQPDPVQFYPCKFCDEQLVSKIELKRHMVNVHVKADVKDVMTETSKLKKDQTPEIEPQTEPEKASIEGVLKCKVCQKYIKQSAMADHKLSHGDGNKSKISAKDNPNIEMAKSVVCNKKTPDGPMKRKSIDPIDKHTEEDDNDDPDDEDWDVKKAKMEKSNKGKMLACEHCKKKFGSSLGLTTHERMMHKELKTDRENKSSATVVLSREF